MGQIYNSDSVSMAAGGGGGSGGPTLPHVPAGQTLAPLTASPGIYYLDVGAMLKNGPAAIIIDIYRAVVTVRVTGLSV